MLREATDSLVRDAFSRIASTVAVVGVAHGGALHAMTVTSFASLSMDPPRLLVCVAKTARTHAALAARSAFALNVLAECQEGPALRFATSGGPAYTGEDLQLVGGVPVVPDAAVTLLCHKEKVHDEGDHDIVVARITAVHLTDSAPLLHHRRAFTAVGTPRADRRPLTA
ncbi:flavin reductase family protein [Streptomyces sp. WAC08241]|uniref:flavin reductase family protein n=1 Tax=Streptomyces sp. WAC08241 TaxID=2487421 RepID=UPI000F76754E|nr:flavin reductase family protein [Streptomyces sp. WAC08241]RSS41969.1 flavin reductase [Streptomyces sp. WAC08241]